MRPWKPLTARTLKAIIADTERDSPDGKYCADDVYRLAREVEQRRRVCERADAMAMCQYADVGGWENCLVAKAAGLRKHVCLHCRIREVLRGS